MKHLARIPIWIYRYGISPFTVGSCRFHPTCSAYANEAIEVHGARRGLMLTLRRLMRCHPWGGCGVDAVPPRKKEQK